MIAPFRYLASKLNVPLLLAALIQPPPVTKPPLASGDRVQIQTHHHDVVIRDAELVGRVEGGNQVGGLEVGIVVEHRGLVSVDMVIADTGHLSNNAGRASAWSR